MSAMRSATAALSAAILFLAIVSSAFEVRNLSHMHYPRIHRERHPRSANRSPHTYTHVLSQVKSMVSESAHEVHALALAETNDEHAAPLFISLLSKVHSGISEYTYQPTNQPTIQRPIIVTNDNLGRDHQGCLGAQQTIMWKIAF